jgi:hypothetical protein
LFKQEAKDLLLYSKIGIAKTTAILVIFILVGASLTLTYFMTMQTDAFPASSSKPVSPQTWAKTYYGVSGDNSNSRRDGRGYSIIQSSDGGYAVTGYAITPDGPLKWDVLLVKIDAFGNLQWEKTYGGLYDDFGYSVIESSDGGFVIAGWANSLNNVGGDVYLIKTDAAGNMLWNRTYDGVLGNSVIESDDGYLIAGYSYSQGNYDVYLVKTDLSGNLQWTKTYGDKDSDEYGYSIIAASTDEGYVITGYTINSASQTSAYLVKVDSNGNMTWDNIYAANDYTTAYSVAKSSDEGYILTGGSSLIKTDYNGNMQWSKSLGNESEIKTRSIIQVNDGYLIAGYAAAPPLGPVVIFGVYLVKTDLYGNILWNNTYGGWGYDYCYSVIQSFDGDYVAAGYTQSPEYNGGVFVVKTDTSGKIQS